MHKLSAVCSNILVSGAAGDIGIGIGRILLDLGISKVIGCDIISDHAGECIFHNCHVVPRAAHADYLPTLKTLLQQEQIDVFIPTSEAEIHALQEEIVDRKLWGIPVLIADAHTVETALDKISTAQWLSNNGLNAPWTLSTESTSPKMYPCIYKPRSGQGSKGLQIIQNEADARNVPTTAGYIWQELLEPAHEEYTCGIFRSSMGNLRTILFQRTLQGGFTGKGEVIKSSTITTYIEEIAEKLELTGAVNFQLRLTAKGPYLFEINPRFSSTVVFRHKLGFEDVLWALEDLLELPISEYTPPAAGTKFYRGITEYFK